ncbi:MAG: hypothetical protein U0457_01825 [Candidatus Sericytochromatia bacterium]
MKKILLVLSLTILSLSACTPTNTPSPSASNNTQSPSPSASTPPSTGNTLTKEKLITFFTCVKGKIPTLGPAMDVYIEQVNKATATDLAIIISSYEPVINNYSSTTGCVR